MSEIPKLLKEIKEGFEWLRGRVVSSEDYAKKLKLFNVAVSSTLNMQCEVETSDASTPLVDLKKDPRLLTSRQNNV